MNFCDRKKVALGKAQINVCVIKGDLALEKVFVEFITIGIDFLYNYKYIFCKQKLFSP